MNTEQHTAPPMIIITTTARYFFFVDRCVSTHCASDYFGGYSAEMSVCDMCECFHAGFIVITKIIKATNEKKEEKKKKKRDRK